MLVVVDMYEKNCSPNLLATLKMYEKKFKVVKKLSDLNNVDVSALILTGSPFRLTPGHDKGRENIKSKKINLAIYCLLNYNVPVLGICFGFQLINVLHGGTVKEFGRLVLEEQNGMHFNFNDMIDKVGIGFVVKKRVKVDGRNVVCHIEKRISISGRHVVTGCAFHPESDRDHGGFLRNWLDGFS